MAERNTGLKWGTHFRDGAAHMEWCAPCGCAYHPEGEQGPHVHPCAEHGARCAAPRSLIQWAREIERSAGALREGGCQEAAEGNAALALTLRAADALERLLRDPGVELVERARLEIPLSVIDAIEAIEEPGLRPGQSPTLLAKVVCACTRAALQEP